MAKAHELYQRAVGTERQWDAEAELRAALAAQHPVIAPLLPASRIAVDHAFATDSSPLREGAELALIPPVSGGLK